MYHRLTTIKLKRQKPTTYQLHLRRLHRIQKTVQTQQHHRGVTQPTTQTTRSWERIGPESEAVGRLQSISGQLTLRGLTNEQTTTYHSTLVGNTPRSQLDMLVNILTTKLTLVQAAAQRISLESRGMLGTANRTMRRINLVDVQYFYKLIRVQYCRISHSEHVLMTASHHGGNAKSALATG